MAKKRETTTDPGSESVTAMHDSTQGADWSAEEHEEIARLAYRYWQERGCPIGSPDEDCG